MTHERIIRKVGLWNKLRPDQLRLQDHHALRIQRTIAPTSYVNDFERNIGKTAYRGKIITKGKYKRIPGRIAIARLVFHAPGRRPQKTKKYLSVFDAAEGKPIGKGGPINIGHEPLHIRHDVFAHEHGLKRNEFSALTFIEERMFLVMRRKFGSEANQTVRHCTPKEFELAFEALRGIKDIKQFSQMVEVIIRVMKANLLRIFPSKIRFMRALILLNRDPKMRTLMRKLNNTPIVQNAKTDYLAYVQPQHLTRLKKIVEMYRFMVSQATQDQKT